MKRIEDVLFWVFFILAIIFFIWFLLGRSPTFEQSLLTFVIGWIIKLHGEIKAVATRLEEHMKTSKK